MRKLFIHQVCIICGFYMGFYSSLEDKWYSLLDKIDSKIPIYKIVDPIDNVFPSFVLFLIILTLLIIFLLFSFSSTLKPIYDVEITVLTSNNIPIKDALVRISLEDEEKTLRTDQFGKLLFESNEENIIVNISKENFRTISETINVNESHIFRLQSIETNADNIFEARDYSVTVTDSANNILTNAIIDFLCDGVVKQTLSNQPTSGFLLKIEDTCEVMQLRATNFGYEGKTITITQSDQRSILKLNKLVNEATVIFKASDSNNSPLKDVEILIKDEFGSIKKNLLTSSNGEVETKLDFGTYTYVAKILGKTTIDNFEISSKNFKEINIIIQGITVLENGDVVVDGINTSNSTIDVLRDIAFEIVDTNNAPIFGVSVIIYRDGNIYSEEKRTNTIGRTPFIRTTSSDTSEYKAFINMSGYEVKLVDVILQTKGEFQKIVLERPRTKLKVNLVNDTGAAERNGVVRIYSSYLTDPIVTMTVDNNGSTTINNLSPGIYTIFAISSNKKVEAREEITLEVNSEIEKTIVLVTGSGKLKFYFVDIQNGREVNVLPDNNFFINNGTSYLRSDLINKKTSYFETQSLVVGTKNKILVVDSNFFRKETFEYEIMRSTQSKKTYLKGINSLPNNNKFQLFFDQAFDNNPISSVSESEAKKFVSGKEYYLLFDLIVNSTELEDTITNFSVDKNGVYIEDIITTNEYIRLMVNELEQTNVDWSNEENYVDEKAKQAKLIINNVQGKIAIPILVKISIDANIEGAFNLKYSTGSVDEQSLSYSREFGIGLSFCTNDCPTFVFDNFLMMADKNEPIPDTDRLTLFNGNEYKIKTIITNLSDQSFGQIFLYNTIEQKYLEKISFENDANLSKQNLVLEPLSSSQESISKKLETKNQVGTFEIEQKLFDAQEQAFPQSDNTNIIRLRIRNKEEIEVDVQPIQLEPEVIYPLVLIRTKYKTGAKAVTNWTIKKLVGTEKIDIGAGYYGTTDINGMSFIVFDTTSLSENDSIIITAENEEAIPGEKIIVLKRILQPVITNAPQTCIEVNTSGSNNLISLNVDESSSFTIKETCGQEKNISLVSDLLLSEISFTLSANETKTISLTATIRDGLLGVYPIRVYDRSLLREAGMIDVVIKDPNSCFDLEQAIFDFTTTNKISSKITNNCFEGRKDNFYPKLDISTNSVSLTFNKPGNPQDLNLNIEVIGSAVEAIVYGFGFGTYWKQISKKGETCSGSPTKTQKAPGELDLVNEAAEIFVGLVEDLSSLEMGDRPITEFDLNRPIPNQSWSTSNIEVSGNNTINNNKIYFEDSAPTGTSFAIGDVLNYYPTPIGDVEAEVGPCELEHEMEWVAAPRPPSYLDVSGVWKGVTEEPWGSATIKEKSHCNPCKVTALGFNEELIRGILYTRGKDPPWYYTVGSVIGGAVVGGVIGGWWGAGIGAVAGGTGALFSNWGADRATLALQPEFYRAVAWGIERENTWSEEQLIHSEEGKIYNLGSYLEATPVPEWVNEETAFDHSPGDVWDEELLTKTITGVAPLGFVPREITSYLSERGEGANMLSSELPYVEADPSGIIHYRVNWETVPDGVDAWLNNGVLFAEYVGEPQISSKDIDFNITRNNLLGREYAIIRVADWVSGEEKQIKGFQVKLTGPINNCVSMSGINGVTGTDFVPKLNFNWNWSDIGIDACDLTNNNYHYCDATQFNISLFKKLFEIDNLLKQSAFHLIPQKTVFYSYLIKDNYSQNFLDDFEAYYSNEFAGTEPFFNEKFNNFIKQDKLEYLYNRQEDQTQLPYGGLYRIEISIEQFDQGINSLFDGTQPIKDIKISIIPIQKAQNYNLFYETPFNGLVGKTGSTFERDGYGVSFEGTNIRINSNIMTNEFDNAQSVIQIQNASSLSQLNTGTVLDYSKAGNEFNLTITPSQPNPIIMLIDNNTTKNFSVSYSLKKSGADLNVPIQKTWALVSSTLGQQKCLDIREVDQQLFKETSPRKLAWNNTKVGKIWLGTTFFTPKEATPTQLQPISQNISIYSILPLNQRNAMLDYYNQLGDTNYDTIQSMLEMVRNEKMCITNENEERVIIWWNPEYLTELIKGINPASNKDCLGDGIIPLINDDAYLLPAMAPNVSPSTSTSNTGQSTGGGSGTTTTTQQNYQRISRFLWKPIADGGGPLVVLYSGVSGRASIYGPEGNLIESGRHDTHSARVNGWGDATRFSKHGRDYPDGSYLVVGSYGCRINDTSQRQESC